MKNVAVKAVNDAMISLYWEIGKRLTEEITGVNKPEYGKRVVIEISNRLSVNYGSGFGRSAISRMINFYQEFPDYEKVATLSQQLTWSHFVEILPIKDALKREFYAVMCKSENWSVRTLRERKKSMLYERTAISKKPDETIKNVIAELIGYIVEKWYNLNVMEVEEVDFQIISLFNCRLNFEVYLSLDVNYIYTYTL